RGRGRRIGLRRGTTTPRLRARHDEGPRRSARREAACRLSPRSRHQSGARAVSFVAHVAAPAVPLRVLIADDHAPTREDVRRALTDGGLIVCAEAADAARAVQQALETRPDICLLDVRMPGSGV